LGSFLGWNPANQYRLVKFISVCLQYIHTQYWKLRIQSYDRDLQRQRSKKLQFTILRSWFTTPTLLKFTTPRVAKGVRFENRKLFFFFEKRSNLLQRWRCSCKFGATFFSESQVAECQIFDANFTKIRTKTIFSKRQMFDTLIVWVVTSSNPIISNTTRFQI
jgi:hypothetical protein